LALPHLATEVLPKQIGDIRLVVDCWRRMSIERADRQSLTGRRRKRSARPRIIPAHWPWCQRAPNFCDFTPKFWDLTPRPAA